MGESPKSSSSCFTSEALQSRLHTHKETLVSVSFPCKNDLSRACQGLLVARVHPPSQSVFSSSSSSSSSSSRRLVLLLHHCPRMDCAQGQAGFRSPPHSLSWMNLLITDRVRVRVRVTLHRARLWSVFYCGDCCFLAIYPPSGGLVHVGRPSKQGHIIYIYYIYLIICSKQIWFKDSLEGRLIVPVVGRLHTPGSQLRLGHDGFRRRPSCVCPSPALSPSWLPGKECGQ